MQTFTPSEIGIRQIGIESINASGVAHYYIETITKTGKKNRRNWTKFLFDNHKANGGEVRVEHF